MKTLFLILFFITMSFCSMAQKWAVPGAKWSYGYSWMSPPSYFTFFIMKDTIVNGKSCQQIGNDQSLKYYNYFQNDTVFMLLNGKFRPTYYFNVNAGDTVSFYNIGNCNEKDSVLLAVIDSITLYNPSLPLKKYNTTLLLDSTSSIFISRFDYTERIGSDKIVYPYFECVIDPELFSLICYTDDELLQNNLSGDCVASVGERTIFRSDAFPNPFSNNLQIKIENAQLNDAELVLTDLLGRTVAREKLRTELTNFNTQDWEKGMYVWSLVEDGLVVKSGKVVKE